MFNPVQLIPGAIAAMFAEAMATRTVTIQDRYGMMAAMLNPDLTAQDRQALDRMLYAIRRGILTVA
ncbi:MAG: hypothetical protein ACPGVO_08425 [Spirulinaceae cyanobacterium]